MIINTFEACKFDPNIPYGYSVRLFNAEEADITVS